MKSNERWAVTMTLDDIKISLLVCAITVMGIGIVFLAAWGTLKAIEFLSVYSGLNSTTLTGWNLVSLFVVFGMCLITISIALAYRENLRVVNEGGNYNAKDNGKH